MKIRIEVEIDDASEHVDPEDGMGITAEAYDRLTGASGEPPLGWLGEVGDVMRVL